MISRVTTPSRVYESVPEVATDVADSGAQSGSFTDSWLVICQWWTSICSKSESQGQGLSDFSEVDFF